MSARNIHAEYPHNLQTERGNHRQTDEHGSVDFFIDKKPPESRGENRAGTKEHGYPRGIGIGEARELQAEVRYKEARELKESRNGKFCRSVEVSAFMVRTATGMSFHLFGLFQMFYQFVNQRFVVLFKRICDATLQMTLQKLEPHAL